MVELMPKNGVKGDGQPLPRRYGSTKSGRTRRMNKIEEFRRELETYFEDHPDELGRTWIPRTFADARKCVRYYGWLRTNQLLMPPRYRVVTRGQQAFHTITDNGQCWDENGDLVLPPLWWRKEHESGWLDSSE